MLIQKDNFHISFRPLDGYNKDYNFIISAREAGKSTEWIAKAWSNYKDGGTSLIIRRQVVDITDAYISSIEAVINKFHDENVKLKYKLGTLKDGVVYLYIDDKLFACVIALSITISRVKSLVLRNIRSIFFDEFIVNPTFKEKYLPNEATRFKEVYNTFYRETDKPIKCYFMGNPYSHFNPYFIWLGVNTKALKQGSIQVGSNWAVWCYKLTDELREYILKRNPLYEFDDSYTRYGFDGEAVCDNNIRVGTRPNNYSLKFVFKVEGKYIAIYKNEYYIEGEDKYFAEFTDAIGASRTSYCFDFNELVDGCALVGVDERVKFQHFKAAMRRRAIVFSSIEVYYLVEEVYSQL